MTKIVWMLSLLLPFFGFAQIADSSERKVNLAGAVNFRDLGGYETSDGHHVKWRKIYRSADISRLSDGDLDSLEARKILFIVDLRGTDESKKAPDHLRANIDHILCPAGSDSTLTNWMKAISGLKSGGDSMMLAFYAKTDFLADRYKPMFAKLEQLPDRESLLMHCTAGKDRTGIGAALLLYILGVPYATIVNDYTATNYYRQRETEVMVKQMVNGMHIDEGVARAMASAKKEYLDETFQTIIAKYGSMENFIKGPLQLDDEKIALLKSKFLE